MFALALIQTNEINSKLSYNHFEKYYLFKALHIAVLGNCVHLV